MTMSPNLRTLVGALIAADVLKDDPNLTYQVERTRAGHWQKSEGAWSFEIRAHDATRGYPIGFGIGSQWNLAECANAAREGRLSIYTHDFTGDRHIEVEKAPGPYTLPPFRGQRFTSPPST